MLHLAVLDKVHFIAGATFVINGTAGLVTSRSQPGRQIVKLRARQTSQEGNLLEIGQCPIVAGRTQSITQGPAETGAQLGIFDQQIIKIGTVEHPQIGIG
jgi:hypothetical protein